MSTPPPSRRRMHRQRCEADREAPQSLHTWEGKARRGAERLERCPLPASSPARRHPRRQLLLVLRQRARSDERERVEAAPSSALRRRAAVDGRRAARPQPQMERLSLLDQRIQLTRLLPSERHQLDAGRFGGGEHCGGAKTAASASSTAARPPPAPPPLPAPPRPARLLAPSRRSHCVPPLPLPLPPARAGGRAAAPYPASLLGVGSWALAQTTAARSAAPPPPCVTRRRCRRAGHPATTGLPMKAGLKKAPLSSPEASRSRSSASLSPLAPRRPNPSLPDPRRPHPSPTARRRPQRPPQACKHPARLRSPAAHPPRPLPLPERLPPCDRPLPPLPANLPRPPPQPSRWPPRPTASPQPPSPRPPQTTKPADRATAPSHPPAHRWMSHRRRRRLEFRSRERQDFRRRCGNPAAAAEVAAGAAGGGGDSCCCRCCCCRRQRGRLRRRRLRRRRLRRQLRRRRLRRRRLRRRRLRRRLLQLRLLQRRQSGGVGSASVTGSAGGARVPVAQSRCWRRRHHFGGASRGVWGGGASDGNAVSGDVLLSCDDDDAGSGASRRQDLVNGATCGDALRRHPQRHLGRRVRCHRQHGAQRLGHDQLRRRPHHRRRIRRRPHLRPHAASGGPICVGGDGSGGLSLGRRDGRLQPPTPNH